MFVMGKKQYKGRPGRAKKRRFKGNQFQNPSLAQDENSGPEEAAAENVLPADGDAASMSEDSDSSSDEDASDDADCQENDPQAFGFRLIDLECLATFVAANLSCKRCGGAVTLQESKRDGLATTLEVECSDCENSSSQAMSRKISRAWEVNRRCVFGMRWIGRGHQSLVKFCAALNMPHPLSQTSYQGHVKILLESSKTVAEASMVRAAAQVKEQTGSADISVSYDGTWMRRGFASLFGAFVAISWETGKVIDFEVLSRYCHECVTLTRKLHSGSLSQEQYDERAASHTCLANTKSSAPAMESAAAKTIWQRSQEHRQLRYTTFIGDGDTKTMSTLRDAAPYGPGVEVQKEECVGHVQKRVGNNLRKLKKDYRGQKLEDGLGLGGQGRLTDRLVDKLQAYYGMAVRGHRNDLQGMARAVWAALMHRVSTDSNPQHQFCPPGADSWCRYQRELAGGPKYTHHESIPEAVFKLIKPIYLRLSERSLLEKCLRGATQNRNESFNGLVWQICPKSGFCSAKTVQIAVALATAWFNDKSQGIENLLDEMGIPKGHFTSVGLARLQREHDRHATRKSSLEIQQRRKKRRRQKKGYEEAIADVEGQTYEPGGF